MNIFEKKSKVKIKRAFQIIEATVADPRIIQILGVRTGSPLLKVERTVYDNRGKPIEFLSILYRSDCYRYTVELIREKNAFRNGWDLKMPSMIRKNSQ
jgi:GntR family transcriptional regulator